MINAQEEIGNRQVNLQVMSCVSFSSMLFNFYNSQEIIPPFMNVLGGLFRNGAITDLKEILYCTMIHITILFPTVLLS